MLRDSACEPEDLVYDLGEAAHEFRLLAPLQPPHGVPGRAGAGETDEGRSRPAGRHFEEP